MIYLIIILLFLCLIDFCAGTSTCLLLEILIALCITTHIAANEKTTISQTSDEDDLPLLQRRSDRIQMTTFKKCVIFEQIPFPKFMNVLTAKKFLL